MRGLQHQDGESECICIVCGLHTQLGCDIHGLQQRFASLTLPITLVSCAITQGENQELRRWNLLDSAGREKQVYEEVSNLGGGRLQIDGLPQRPLSLLPVLLPLPGAPGPDSLIEAHPVCSSGSGIMRHPHPL